MKTNMKNDYKFKYIISDELYWVYSIKSTDIILLDPENSIIKINSMRDFNKIDLIIEKEHRYS